MLLGSSRPPLAGAYAGARGAHERVGGIAVMRRCCCCCKEMWFIILSAPPSVPYTGQRGMRLFQTAPHA